MFEFQIVTETEKEAEIFMAEVQAEDVSIEDWSGIWPGPCYKRYVCSFGVTRYTPRRLNRVADYLGIGLIFIRLITEL